MPSSNRGLILKIIFGTMFRIVLYVVSRLFVLLVISALFSLIMIWLAPFWTNFISMFVALCVLFLERVIQYLTLYCKAIKELRRRHPMPLSEAMCVYYELAWHWRMIYRHPKASPQILMDHFDELAPWVDFYRSSFQ